jgi:hypothetical protein
MHDLARAGESLHRIDGFFVARINRVDRPDLAGGGQRFLRLIHSDDSATYCC